MLRGIQVRRVRTVQLAEDEVAVIRGLLAAAFADDGEDFSDDDWAHAVGGVHIVRDVGGEIIAHDAVVERVLHVGGPPVRTGYVEAVATNPRHQGAGHGSRVMAEAAAIIRERYDLGALSTGSPVFYERLGWLRWTGPSAVRTDRGLVATPADDGGILVLPTPSTGPDLDRSLPISCDWRPGDVW